MFSLRKVILTIAFLLCAVPAWAAAPSVVQVKFAGVGCTTSCTVSFDSTPTIGNHVIAISDVYRGSATVDCDLTALSDNQATGGNTYAVDGHLAANASGDSFGVAHGSAKITKSSGTFTTTFTMAGQCFGDIVILEVANLDPTTWFDRTASNSGSSISNLTVTQSGANTTANAFVVATLVGSGNSVSDPTSGYTRIDLSSSGPNFSSAYKVVTATETSSAAWTAFSGEIAYAINGVYRGIDTTSVKPQGQKIGVLP